MFFKQCGFIPRKKFMQLTCVDILKYKSIKSPVTIYFNEGEVVTLIGKNGSGKTNVLEALNYIFDANAKLNFFTMHPVDLKYRVHIKLTREDLTSILPEIEHEIQALKEAGFSTVELLREWGATCTIKATK